MTKMKLLNKVGCLVAASGLVAGCGTELGTELDAQPVGEVRQAIANGKRFNALAEPSGGAARADLQVYRHEDNTWYVRRTDGVATSHALTLRSALPEDVPVQGNFDGDSLYDVATFRPSNAQFAVRRSSDGSQYTFGFGVSGDFPAVGDFDGDGATDHAIWRPSNGMFYVLRSSDWEYFAVALGQAGDIPVIGNYDGDTKDDFAVWRPSTGTWHFVRSSIGVVDQFQYGAPGDVPVPADYDGDDRTDFAVFSNGAWHIRYARTGATASANWGGQGDYPVPADYDGDGKADIAVWRPSDGGHHMLYSSTGAQAIIQYGVSSDVPANTNMYCRNAQGVLRPCNTENISLGAMSGLKARDFATQCFAPGTDRRYLLPSGGVNETNYYAKVSFSTAHANSGIMRIDAGGLGARDRDIWLSNGNICTYVWGLNSYGGVQEHCSSGVNYADGKLHTVVHTLDSTGNKLYVDGVLRRNGSYTRSDFNSDTHLVIGSGQGSEVAGGGYITPANASPNACILHVEVR
ncbi:MAG TPA: LamG-like jellyroll fold domain-containing protein [Archangium sp.]|nr:LamG-like jellyroll fold domain-containing protein [Archangium sp.]